MMPVTLAADDIRYMRLALEEAQMAAEEGEVPIGAIIVCKAQIIARAHNAVERLNDPTAHAEMLAITMAVDAIGGKYLRDCTLYVTVEPCLMCAGALRWTQIPRVVYGASEPKVGYHLFADNAFHPKCRVEGGILAAESEDLMRTFFASKR
ncbi:nucleoside deaminase [Porphyromonas loveana]|uniref:nucleoside deaminase n=1 Tax=Porphyromonas loveana TaxID=1884669 RepID=UPI0035A1B697